MQQIIKKTFGIILIIVLTFSPLRIDFFYFSQKALADDESPPKNLFITEDTTWNSATDLSQYENIYVDWGVTLTIEKGTQLAFRHLAISGAIKAIGTMEEKIKLTEITPATPLEFVDPSSIIEFNGPGDYEDDLESVLEFVEFSQMGKYEQFDDGDLGLSKQNRVRDFLSTAVYAAQVAVVPAVKVRSGRITMRNCTFDRNAYTDVDVDMEYGEWNTQSYLHIENSNFQNNTQNTAVISNVINKGSYDADLASCFSECKSGYPDDYALYGDACNNYCGNELKDNNYHDRTKVVLKNNWYGHAGGPKTEDNPLAQGENLLGDYVLDGWNSQSFENSVVGVSNVLFLPGIKASRLYLKENDGDEDKLWIPNLNSDVDDLKMDSDGESMKNIHTRDVIEEAIGYQEIYESFVDNLDKLKEEKPDFEYSLFAYDWRKDIEDIAQDGTLYDSEGPYSLRRTEKVIEEIKRLQEISPSKKVTIIAHSMGGLVAKAVMQELERQGKTSLIDNIVMVSSPQMGTPKSILSLLYGYDEKLPIPGIMSDGDARELAENMPSVYGLLPSQKYFDRKEEKIIEFLTEGSVLKKAYGEEIDDYAELKKFLLGEEDGREKPKKNETEKENILNEKLLGQADEMHSRIDSWEPSGNTKLIQIGGWGLDTINKIEYKESEDADCSGDTKIPVCRPNGKFKTIHNPKFTMDGDEVVTTPSSLMAVESDKIEKYWVDLHSYNDDSIFNVNHKDIFEIDSINEFLSYVIENHVSPENLPEYMTDERPSDFEGVKSPRIRMALYSPLNIHIYDENGNHTGPKIISENSEEKIVVEENIPNSYYEVFGEHKFVGFPAGEKMRIEMNGYALGSYSLEFEEVEPTENGERIIASTSFVDLPTTENTTARLEIPTSGISSPLLLQADIDSDGVNDYELTSIVDKEVTLDEKKSKKSEKSKPKIESWKAYQYRKKTDLNCQQRLRMEIKGRKFDDKVEVFIGNQKAKKVEKTSNQKVIATFCMEKLLNKKIGSKRTISAINPNARKEKDDKKIDLANVLIK